MASCWWHARLGEVERDEVEPPVLLPGDGKSVSYCFKEEWEVFLGSRRGYLLLEKS